MGVGRPSLMGPCSPSSSVTDDSVLAFLWFLLFPAQEMSKNLRLRVALQNFVLKLFY